MGITRAHESSRNNNNIKDDNEGIEIKSNAGERSAQSPLSIKHGRLNLISELEPYTSIQIISYCSSSGICSEFMTVMLDSG